MRSEEAVNIVLEQIYALVSSRKVTLHKLRNTPVSETAERFFPNYPMQVVANALVLL